MTVKVWHSYSCNNSSSYRLVARFAGPATAEAVATELRELFPVHAAEIDARPDYSEDPSEAQHAFGAKHGFSWSESLQWGDGGLVGDEPDVFVYDDVLIVQHTYCSGLELAGVIKTLGAVSADEKDQRSVGISLLFRAVPGSNPMLDSELAEIAAQLGERKDRYSDLKPPWADHETYGAAAYFRDAGTVGLYLPADPRDLAALKKWLVDREIEKSSLRIEEPTDHALFEALAKARCSACNGALEYLDPRLHDIESPQLVCKPCGGLYDLATFLQ